MGFINASPFVNIISSYRLLWIGGRFGGHKTSMAYKLAEPYLDRGYRLLSNNRSVWSDRMEDIDFNDRGQLKLVVLLDEGGLYFKASRQIEMVASYARKMDICYIFPSFYPVARAAQVLTCSAMFNLNSAGVPLYLYRWRVNMRDFKDSGVFAWFNPSEVYGLYDTLDPGESGDDIVAWLIKKTGEYRSMFGRKNDSISVMEVDEADRLDDAVGAFADAADTLSAIPNKRRRR